MAIKALSLDEDVVVATLGLALAGQGRECFDLAFWERSFTQKLAVRVNSLDHAAFGELQSNTIGLCDYIALAMSPWYMRI